MKKFVFIFGILIVWLSGSMLNAGSLNFKVGIFYPQLNSELWKTNINDLVFEKKDMRSEYYAMEYEYFLNPNFSLAVEGGYYQKKHYSWYRNYHYVFLNNANIYQNLSLWILNLELGFKFYPIGHQAKFLPFIGGGAGIYYWKYKQWGDFVNVVTDVVHANQYEVSSAYTPGFNVKGGFTYRLTRMFGLTVEGRYQYVKGKLSSFFENFDKLDMSGFSALVGINVSF